METKQRLRRLAAEHQGILRTSDVVDAGISKAALADFVKENGFRKACRGIYCDPEVESDPFYLLQQRCPRTIFSHETALFFHHLIDDPPAAYTITARTGYNPARLTREGIKVYTVKESVWSLGVMECQTPFGNPVLAYDRERSICDMVRSRSSVDGQVFLDVMTRYARYLDKDLDLLMDYAKQLRAEHILHRYLKVLP